MHRLQRHDPKLTLQTATEANAEMQSRISSGDYWIIPVATKEGALMSDAIEQTYYIKDGVSQKEFEIVIIPFSVLPDDAHPTINTFFIAFAEKSLMSRDQLNELMRRTKDGDSRVSNVILPQCTPGWVKTWLLENFDWSEPVGSKD